MPYLNDQVKALKLDGITPSYQNITTNKWKLWSYEHMYTNKKRTMIVQKSLSSTYNRNQLKLN